jgi:hypothetical protein
VIKLWWGELLLLVVKWRTTHVWPRSRSSVQLYCLHVVSEERMLSNWYSVLYQDFRDLQPRRLTNFATIYHGVAWRTGCFRRIHTEFRNWKQISCQTLVSFRHFRCDFGVVEASIFRSNMLPPSSEQTSKLGGGHTFLQKVSKLLYDFTFEKIAVTHQNSVCREDRTLELYWI